MKRLIALLLVCLISITAACAGEWPEGLGPEKPFPGLRERDLTKEMGYYFLIPKEGFEAQHFCDTLQIYLPREDVALGDGHAHLCDASGEILDIDFSNAQQVEIRPMEQSELEEFPHPWGGGTCIEIHLPMSLKFDGGYYVLMDLNCFTAQDGKVSNYTLTSPEQWAPKLTGEYGVSGLYYCTATAKPVEDEEFEEGEEIEEGEELEELEEEPTEAPEEEPVVPKYEPQVGDDIHFDLVLGGPAKTAVVYSENDSAYFEVLEFTESCEVTGTVTKDDLEWGVVFLNENDEMVDVLRMY